jgi:hypothetical protein
VSIPLLSSLVKIAVIFIILTQINKKVFHIRKLGRFILHNFIKSKVYLDLKPENTILSNETASTERHQRITRLSTDSITNASTVSSRLSVWVRIIHARLSARLFYMYELRCQHLAAPASVVRFVPMVMVVERGC